MAPAIQRAELGDDDVVETTWTLSPSLFASYQDANELVEGYHDEFEAAEAMEGAHQREPTNPFYAHQVGLLFERSGKEERARTKRHVGVVI